MVNGKKTKGVITANYFNDAKRRLTEKKLRVLDIKEHTDVNLFGNKFSKKRLKSDTISHFCRQWKVYWTKEDKLYHLNKECEKMLQGEVLWGNSDQSGSRQSDLNCVGDMSNTVDVQVFTKATGDVSANIKFIVYSSEKDIIKLETDKPSQWKPGKNNPFEDTLS